MLAFAGPAYLVSVGYMDPGNWATDLAGGSTFGYKLLWVLVLSNAMAVLLQTLSARLGIVTGRDLAQACREAYPLPVSHALWGLCEIAIAACDLAEVLGAAIGLHLLFGVPLVWGVLATALDTVLVLWLTRYGIRLVEAITLVLILVMTGCFLVEMGYAHPVMAEVFSGLLPRVDGRSLYIAVGIIGATVMPHNLYLHSALVQTRRIGRSSAQKREACNFNFADSFIALNAALVVNGAILVLAAAVFFKHNIAVTEIEQAHQLLAPLVGSTLASVLFAVALLASGQSSTLTGTFAGQIVMEGFLNLRMRPWLRRLVTRSLAIIPAVITVSLSGAQGTYQLLILSQVIINMQLPFAVIPLIRFTNDPGRMGEFANRSWVKVLAWITAAVIVGLNFWLIADVTTPWIAAAPWRAWILMPPVVTVAALLAWVAFATPRSSPADGSLPAQAGPPGAAMASHLPAPVYRHILVPLDHSARDVAAIAHAAAMGRPHGATIHLLHVEEGATSQLFGELSATAEIHAGEEYFDAILKSLDAEGLTAELTVAHGRSPKDEIVRAAREIHADLVVMGAHGHRGVKDLIFGDTINGVRHEVSVPVLVVADPPSPGRR
jgi:manganese transport protein